MHLVGWNHKGVAGGEGAGLRNDCHPVYHLIVLYAARSGHADVFGLDVTMVNLGFHGCCGLGSEKSSSRRDRGD